VDAVEFSEISYLAKTIFGEARGESYMAKCAVAWVIRNRVKARGWPNTYRGVVTQPYQFSSWLKGDPNRERMLDPLAVGGALEEQAWYDSIRAAYEVYHAPEEPNPLPGVFHYIDTSIDPPKWARKMEAVRLPYAPRFVFFRS